MQTIMDTRAAKSAAEAKAREAVKAEAERVMKLQVAEVAAEKEKQVRRGASYSDPAHVQHCNPYFFAMMLFA